MGDLYRTSAGRDQVRAWCRTRIDAWPVPHETHTLTTSLGETHLLASGEGDRVCVYLPGTNFNSAASLELLGHMGSRCSVVAPDLPGQPGLSAATRPRQDVAAYGSWMHDVVAWTRAEHPGLPVVVVGHSRGAAVALTGPVDVDALVLVSPAGLVRARVGAAVLKATLPWLVRPTDARSRALLLLMSGPGAHHDPALVSWMTLVARETRTTGAPGPLPDAILSRWSRTHVRVVVGEHDCFFAAERVRQASTRLGGGATVEVLDGVGHLSVEEAPGSVARIATERR